MPHYFLRKHDGLEAVYEVDFDTNTWKLFRSDIGVPVNLREEMQMPDQGAIFLGEGYREVWIDTDDGAGNVTFSPFSPERLAEKIAQGPQRRIDALNRLEQRGGHNAFNQHQFEKMKR